MSPPRHVRSTSHGKKLIPAHARPTKPPPIKTNKHASTFVRSPRSNKPIGKRETAQSSEDEEEHRDEDDMAGLPSFCTYCEKQIVTPCSTVLYCSESCRRKDGSKPLSTASIESPESSPRAFSVSSEPRDYPDIVPHRSPTVRPASLASVDGTSLFDMDSLASQSDTEAAKFLSQFQATSISPTRQRRPQYRRAQTSSNATMPSLSHTPGSLISPSSSFSSLKHLPARTNPYGPPMGYRSVDLVVPITAPSSLNGNNGSLHSNASTGTVCPVAKGEMIYQKKSIAAASPGKGSLQQLFSHDAIIRKPTTRTK